MTVLTIRNVPRDVHATLSRDARERGQSLQAYVLNVLERQAAFGRNRELVAEVEQDISGAGGAGTDAPDSAELIAAGRNRHDSDAVRRA